MAVTLRTEAADNRLLADADLATAVTKRSEASTLDALSSQLSDGALAERELESAAIAEAEYYRQLAAENPGGSSTTLFAYNESGALLGEYDNQGNPIQETVWLGSMPVATLQSGNIYPVHTDHLGAPRVITDASGGIVWQWVSDPFGTTIANSDPDGDGQHFVYSLRFPGQYYDAETGRHYNYFRDYDPNTGRYIQSDPIGLEGGLNTYLYSNANPINYFDLFGLMSNYMACIVDCNMIFDWDTQDRLDTLIGYHTDCSFKSRQAVGNCAVAAIGTDIGLTYYNRGKLQKCLMQCKDYHESDCNE